MYESSACYYELACEMAIFAADNLPANSRGIRYLAKQDLVCYFDNCGGQRHASVRDELNRRVANRVRQRGMEILAETHDGRDEASAMLLNCSRDRIPLVHQIVVDEADRLRRDSYSDL